jgi:sialate O-acetylesterase
MKLPFRSLRIIALLGMFSTAFAEVKLNGIFSDNLVLQRELPAPVWGSAAPGETVTLAFAGQKKSAVADAAGKWRVVLDPLTASAENRVITVTGDKTSAPVVVKNVLVGEVWHCGGQSNMEWGIARSTDKESIIAASANPLLRMGRMDHHSELSPLATQPVKWNEASPATVKWYSAVPYLFGAGLQKELGVPVGIINSAYGGTRIECWLDADTLKNGPWPQDDFVNVAAAKADYDAKVAKHQPAMDAYLAEKAKARAEKRPDPAPVEGWPGEFRGPTVLWNGEIAPIAGYAMRGMVWNQGENNSQPGTGPRYLQLLTALARSYRAAWGQGDFPLIVMQLCTYKKPGGYAEYREAQLKFTQADRNSALIVTLDQSAPDGDVHYPDKREVSDRTVRAALGLVYQRPGEYSGPIFDAVKFNGREAVVSFKHLGGGLVAKDGQLRHFELAGADKKFVPADARIAGDTVVVSAASVAAPAFVRYAFSQFPWPPANLFNKVGLPASSFRSDD